jgi:hypothetical protein
MLCKYWSFWNTYNECVIEWMNEWINEWMNECMIYYAIINLSHFMCIALLDIDKSTIICMIVGLMNN